MPKALVWDKNESMNGSLDNVTIGIPIFSISRLATASHAVHDPHHATPAIAASASRTF